MSDTNRMATLRGVEISNFYHSSGGVETMVVFDEKEFSVQGALYAIYLTIFIIFLLLGGITIFSNDVNSLVIMPIENMVDLVKRISVNPLGVEYKLMSEKELNEGRETALLLQTINKIGSLMRIG